MASSSHRRSGSSGRSTQRKRVHLGTGTESRVASERPHTQAKVKVKVKQPERAGVSTRADARRRTGAATSGTGRRATSPQQLERLRRQAEQRKVLRTRIIVAACVVAAVWAAWVGVSRSSLLSIDEVDVTGVERLQAESVVATAAVPADATLLNVDVGAIERRIAADPWVASVSVSRRLPSTLRIAVDERRPAAIVDTGVSFWFVDRYGRVLGESAPDGAAGLPVVRDLKDFVAEPGLVSSSDGLLNALDVLAGVDDDLLAMVKTVTAPSVNETALLTAAGMEIMIGEAERLAEKSALVRDILAEQGGGVVFIDVRNVERPISRGIAP